jgi:glutathione-regulated potassium-efflux system protein KefB
VLVCVDKGDTAVRIAEQLKAEFPLVPVLVRAYDRGVTMKLVEVGVDYQIRETFESALLFGRTTLERLGVEPEAAAEVILDVRRRDEARLEAQIAGGLQAGRGFFKGNMPAPVPAPLAPPRSRGRAMNEEAADALDQAAREGAT